MRFFLVLKIIGFNILSSMDEIKEIWLELKFARSISILILPLGPRSITLVLEVFLDFSLLLSFFQMRKLRERRE